MHKSQCLQAFIKDLFFLSIYPKNCERHKMLWCCIGDLKRCSVDKFRNTLHVKLYL